MQKRNQILLMSALALILLVVSPFLTVDSKAWSNGGYSANPATPDYGTHDWIAEHALDWLPQQEKQWLLDNKAVYLYGTELPDNNQAVDGIGDTTKHHVYYRADGSVQDDAAAIRARDEYAKAVNAYKMGNRSGAAKELGIVTHYIADMAVYAHVMGSSTAWGAEKHHSDYEDNVQKYTNIYVGTFRSFLVFDGSLSTKTAYDAALALAHDSTFDDNGDLTCVWMDTHYDWSNSQFANRAGESINLAVNTVADVLHTFYSETVVPEFPSSLALALLLLLVLPVALMVRRKGKEKNSLL